MKHDALVLVGEHCPLCDHAHRVLEHLSREYPLEVRTLPWEGDEARALRERDGVAFPPALYVDGVYWTYGRLSERQLHRRFARLRRARLRPLGALALLALGFAVCAYVRRRPR